MTDSFPEVEVHAYEVWYDAGNRALMERFATAFGSEPSGVPATFVADRYWVGYAESVGRQIIDTVYACREQACPDVGAAILAGEPLATALQTARAAASTTALAPATAASIITLPLIGEIDLAAQSLGVSTALIALVDGFNPCSLWVLSILLALVIHSGSRRRILLVGTTFLTVTSAAYIVFILGLFGVLSVVGYIGWIQAAVALIALVFALINIKDYFWYKQGVSLTIPDSQKPRLYRQMRGVMASDKTMLAVVGATGAMALGVTLLELPCTSGLPVLWTNMIVANDVPTGTFIVLLALYMLIFLIDELALFLTAVFTLRVSKFEEKHGRVLKLFGGMVMLALALVMVFEPTLMNDLGLSLLVFATALGAAVLVLVLHQRVLPKLGNQYRCGVRGETRTAREVALAAVLHHHICRYEHALAHEHRNAVRHGAARSRHLRRRTDRELGVELCPFQDRRFAFNRGFLRGLITAERLNGQHADTGDRV
ncbi:MAG: hypothetical protein HND48_22350 [Chloroflexi bacterium]|nr:hypothetical protein [Chloroflexota bacterium]